MEHALRKVPGVLDAGVNLLTGVAEVIGGDAHSGEAWALAGLPAWLVGSAACCASPGPLVQLRHAPVPPFLWQVRYDPDQCGPRHLLAAVEAVGFGAAPYVEQRLGEQASPLLCLHASSLHVLATAAAS